jgi:hypothetical protein
MKLKQWLNFEWIIDENILTFAITWSKAFYVPDNVIHCLSLLFLALYLECLLFAVWIVNRKIVAKSIEAQIDVYLQ